MQKYPAHISLTSSKAKTFFALQVECESLSLCVEAEGVRESEYSIPWHLHQFVFYPPGTCPRY